MPYVLGLFDGYSDAEIAIEELERREFSRDSISVLAREEATHAGLDGAKPALTNGAESGMATGAALGGLAGLMVGVGAILIPGLGPALMIGSIGAAIAGTVTGTAVGAVGGAATGSLLSALMKMGAPEDEANSLAEGVRRGGVLLAVEAADERVDDAHEVLRRAGAVDIGQRREQLQGSGWGGFDEATVPAAAVTRRRTDSRSA